MSVELLDGTTIRDFVEDEAAFHGSMEDRFTSLDTDQDGLLSYSEMIREIQSLRVLETHFGIDEQGLTPDELSQLHDSLFLQFDHDGDGTVGLDDFKAEIKQILLAVANGLGMLPLQMVLEEGSFLKMAVDRDGEAAKRGAATAA